MLKLLGSILIILSCGLCGFLIAYNHKREVNTLRQLVNMIDFMECKLQYHYTPLPELFLICSKESNGLLKTIFASLAEELNEQILPDVTECMGAVLRCTRDLPAATEQVLRDLGANLGKFDLEGQLKGLEAVKQDGIIRLSKLTQDQQNRLRSYRTLGLCAGAALAILFI